MKKKYKLLSFHLSPPAWEGFLGGKMFKLVSILGIIGAGKTSLMNSEIFASWEKLPECVEKNPWLYPEKSEIGFYEDMKATAAHMEYFLLHRRFADLMTAKKAGGLYVTDWGIESVFAGMLYNSGFMTDREYDTYRLSMGNMEKFILQPDIIIWLDTMPSVAMAWVKKRARGVESKLSLEYQLDLLDAYSNYLLEKEKTTKVLYIPWGSDEDFIPGKQRINDAIFSLEEEKEVFRYCELCRHPHKSSDNELIC